jgi:hypothetical protein
MLSIIYAGANIGAAYEAVFTYFCRNLTEQCKW